MSFYEKTRYSKYDWTRVQSIVVPVDSEELADVSFYQKPMLWIVYAQSKRAVVLRMGQGAWIDPEWDYNYVNAKANGVAVAAYWFYVDRYSPEFQYDLIKKAMLDKNLDMEMWIDWERNFSGNYVGISKVTDLVYFCKSRGLFNDAGMYTGFYWFVENSNPVTDRHPISTFPSVRCGSRGTQVLTL